MTRLSVSESSHSKPSHFAGVQKAPSTDEQKTEGLAYFRPKLSLTQSLLGQAKSTASKVVVVFLGVFLAILETLILIPIELILGNSVIWIINRCVWYHKRKEVVPITHLPTAEETGSTSIKKGTVEVSDSPILATPEQVGRVDCDIQKPTKRQSLCITANASSETRDAARQRKTIDQEGIRARVAAKTGVRPGDFNYEDPETCQLSLKIGDPEEKDWKATERKPVSLDKARVQIYKEDNPIECPRRKPLDLEKQLNWLFILAKIGPAVATALLSLKALNYFRGENNWINIPLSILFGGVAVECEILRENRCRETLFERKVQSPLDLRKQVDFLLTIIKIGMTSSAALLTLEALNYFGDTKNTLTNLFLSVVVGGFVVGYETLSENRNREILLEGFTQSIR